MAPESKQQGAERFVVLTTDRLCFAQSIHQRVRVVGFIGGIYEAMSVWRKRAVKDNPVGFGIDV